METNVLRLREILKSKGIGPSGSKQLNEDSCKEAFHLIYEESLNLITRLTLLVALLTLERNEFEEKVLANLREVSDQLNPVLKRYLSGDTNDPFEKIIFKVIRRENLSQEEAKQSMVYFFDDEVLDCNKAAFLEAERLKRETTLENLSFLEAFWNRTVRKSLNEDYLIDFCNNYDGWARTANYSTITSVFLAHLGVPSLIHGLDRVAPKNGYTTKSILDLLGNKESPKNFFYKDQSQFFPELFAMKAMRHDMVKRPFLATLERLLQPVQVEKGNYQIIGYTHKAYKLEFARIIQGLGKSGKAWIVKGEEGSTQLALSRPSEYALVEGDRIVEGSISPLDFGIHIPEKPKSHEIDPNYIIESLKKDHPAYEYARTIIFYNTLAILHIFKLSVDTPKIESLDSFLDTLV